MNNTSNMMSTYPICHKEDISENGAKDFLLETHLGEIEFFVVRKNGKYFAYVNSCPHTNINLEWVPDRFLDNNNELIQCSTHGTKFTIEDGFCIFGSFLGSRPGYQPESRSCY